MNGEGRSTGRRTWAGRLRAWVDRTGSEILGWVLIPVGIVLMPLPGPGMLIIVGGFALLARHYSWARQLRDRLQVKAVEAARYGVATWPRIVASAFGGLWLLAVGVVWIVGPTIPEFEVLNVGFGPELPAQGWVTGIGVIVSALVAWGLLVYSFVRWREPETPVLPPAVADVIEPVEPAEA
ncbi:PGPGW domain-containing protein [Aeromicrobium sp. Leaf350]|uniref:PGPGW domain-containing protein n=1 Tax=Aeromicrobium sp. Leaf350 TaxID=2876565 RepID=UPI001E2AB5EB|nr:PGPGW domain-containing protein [Aeromicrobium sp. Leaf350]